MSFVDAIYEGVVEILKSHSRSKCNIEKDSVLTADLDFDSLDVVELFMTVEEKYGVTLPQDIKSDITVSEFVEIVRKAKSDIS